MPRLTSRLGRLIGSLYLLTTLTALAVFLFTTEVTFAGVWLLVLGRSWSAAYVWLIDRLGWVEFVAVNTVALSALAALNASLLYLVGSWIEGQWTKGRESDVAVKRLFYAVSISLAIAILFCFGGWTVPLPLYRYALWPGFASAHWLLGGSRAIVPAGLALNVVALALALSILFVSIWSLRRHRRAV